MHMHNLSPNSLHQMESAICLSYCPLPYSSKGFQFQGARPSRFHLKFNHGTPLCVPRFSTTITGPITRSFRHANCMHERFSTVPSQNEGSGNKILRGVTGASLVLACALGLLNFSGAKMNPKFTTAYACSSPKFNTSMLEAKGTGKFVLETLLETMSKAELSSKKIQIPPKFSDLGPSTYEVDNLKLLAIGQSKSGKGRKALEILEEQYGYCRKNSCSEEGNLGMALVEVFMFQENYEEARKRLDEQIDTLLPQEGLNSKQKSDILLDLYNSEVFDFEKVRIARLILYKAIVHTMLEYKQAGPKGTEAVEWRKAFNRIDSV